MKKWKQQIVNEIIDELQKLIREKYPDIFVTTRYTKNSPYGGYIVRIKMEFKPTHWLMGRMTLDYQLKNTLLLRVYTHFTPAYMSFDLTDPNSIDLLTQKVMQFAEICYNYETMKWEEVEWVVKWKQIGAA